MSTLSTFAYQPLDPTKREIRLIEILPLESKQGLFAALKQIWRATLRFEICQASLDDNPDYVALSYVWGSPHRTRTIELNGCAFEVTEALEEALQYIYSKGVTQRLWIDAICINQKDNDEKSWQVQQMRDIYRDAVMVLIWIGTPSGISHEQMEQLRTIGAGINSTRVELIEVSKKPDGSFNSDFVLNEVMAKAVQLSFEKLHLNVTSPICPFPIRAVYKLMGRSWWHRVWVAQELATSQTSFFLCGLEEIDAKDLSASLDLFSLWYKTTIQKSWNGLSLGISEQQLVKPSLDPRPYRMFERWHRVQNLDYPFDLETLLRDITKPESKLQATDPRDIVYAMLGMAVDTEELGVVPNYSKTCAEVYAEVTKSLYQKGHLNILSLCQEPKLQNNLPSWAPDWSFIQRNELQGPDIASAMSQPFKASKALPKPRLIEVGPDDPKALRLRGIRADTIRQTSACWNGPTVEGLQTINDAERLVNATTEWLRGLINLAELSGNDRRAVWRTANADRVNDKTMTWSRLEYYSLDTLNGLIGNKARETALRDSFSGSMIHRVAEERRAFVTVSGRLGIGPKHLRDSDIVVILSGVDLPFILKKHSAAFEVIGEAYVDGIMDGEIKGGDHDMEVFLLK